MVANAVKPSNNETSIQRIERALYFTEEIVAS